MIRRFLHGLLLLALLTNATGSPWAMAAHGSHHAGARDAVAVAHGAEVVIGAQHHLHHAGEAAAAAAPGMQGAHADHSAAMAMSGCSDGSDCAAEPPDDGTSCCGDAGCQCGCLHSATPLRAALRMVLASHHAVHIACRASPPAALRAQPPFRPPAA